MWRTGLLLLWGWMCVSMLPGQNLSVRGEVRDVDTLPFPGVKVELQDQNTQFFRGKVTNLLGQFRFDSLAPGRYFLLLTAPDHDTLRKPLLVSERNPDWGLGRLYLLPQGFDIEGVKITSQIQAVSLKGDTLEFNADAFEVQAYDKVEDLLGQLPGLEIENGQVKVNVELVTRILVNGKEFFGESVKDAIETLPADAVAKVQVYDKSSEEGEFLGIEDEDKTKAINLKLKKIREGSLDGDIGGSIGTRKRYRAKGTLTRIVGGDQFGLNVQSFNLVSKPPEVAQRINQTFSPVALNYTRDLNEKWNYKGVFKYEHARLRQEESTGLLNELDDQLFTTTETRSLDQLSQTLRANNNFRFDADSMTRFNLWTTASWEPGKRRVTKESNTFLGEVPVNENLTLTDRNQYQLNLNTQLKMLRKFKKSGRSMVVRSNFDLRSAPDEKTIFAPTTVYADTFVQRDTLDQFQEGLTRTYHHSGVIKFNEQLSETWRFNTSVEYVSWRNENNRDFFDRSGTEQLLNDSLSDAYLNKNLQYWTHARLRWKKEKLSFFVAGMLKRSTLSGTSASGIAPIEKSFLNFLPRTVFEFKSKEKGTFKADYHPRLRLPRIDELQTVPDNSDPLRVYIGNPDLRPEMDHTLSLNYIAVEPRRDLLFSLRLSGILSQNKVQQTVTIDSVFRQITQPENVNGFGGIMGNTSFYFPVKPVKIAFVLAGNMTWSVSPTIVNGASLPTRRMAPGGKLGLKSYQVAGLTSEIGVKLQANRVTYANAEQPSLSFLNTLWYGKVSWNFLKTWDLNGQFEYTRYQGGALDQQPVAPFISARLGRRFLKEGRGRVEVEVYDLLDRQVAVFRSTQLNYQEDRQVATPGRVFLVGFTYTFRILSSTGH